SAPASRSEPTRLRYGPARDRSQSSVPEPANGSQTASPARTPAALTSAAAMVGCDAAGTSPVRYAKRGSGTLGTSSTRTAEGASYTTAAHGLPVGSLTSPGTRADTAPATRHTAARRLPPAWNASR